MRCPVCQSGSLRVIDSRDTADAVRRRRQCEDCSHRFTTYERLEAMRCPRCHSQETRVMQASELAQSVRRQRECAECGNRFLTSERVDPRGFVVVKRDGRREEFNHGKLLEKIRIACTKRPVPPAAISKLTAEVEQRILALDQAEVSSTIIGDWVIERLRDLDPIAYIRFASVYHDIRTVEAMKRELDALTTEG